MHPAHSAQQTNSRQLEPVAVYVHIPFCPAKCGYCDFNSYAIQGDIVARTVKALVREIHLSPHAGRPAKTIFFGGGTPTFLPVELLLSILTAVRTVHPPIAGCEITSEANPGTADAQKFRDMYAEGFNRLSIGVQSFDDQELKQLDRIHTAQEAYQAYEAARNAGFTNVNLDLMFALPWQSTQKWERNLKSALELSPEHLSLYCLTIEPNTRFYRLLRRGIISLPAEETQREMYELTMDLTAMYGYEQYEISNFSRPGYQCMHNLCYWRAEEYVGYGPGAVERVGTRRWTHIKHPQSYCEAVETGAYLACESESLDEETLRFETIMLGMRLNEGIPIHAFPEIPARAQHLMEKGWIERSNGKIRLTREGRHWCNRVVIELSQ